MNDSVKVFVIHVRGHRAREDHVRREMDRHGIEFEFILDGNVSDIDSARIEKYFAGDMAVARPGTSCALKHLLAYERMIEESVPYALIFEDDIKLSEDFNAVFRRSLDELASRGFQRLLVSYESSGLVYVKASERKSGVLLYPQPRGRCTGAYLLDLDAAKAIIGRVHKERCSTTIDWFHNECADHGEISIYWCEPPIAEQLSHNGGVASLLAERSDGVLRRWSFAIQRWYKRRRSDMR